MDKPSPPARSSWEGLGNLFFGMLLGIAATLMCQHDSKHFFDGAGNLRRKSDLEIIRHQDEKLLHRLMRPRGSDEQEAHVRQQE